MEIKEVTLVRARAKTKDMSSAPSQIKITGDKKDYLGEGTEAIVQRVTIPVKGKEIGGLAFKSYLNEKNAEEAFKVWEKLKAAGLPVPSTFRLVKEGDSSTGILMTDLTSGHRDLFITTNPGKADMLEQTLYAHRSTIKEFAWLDLRDPKLTSAIGSKLSAIATLATQHKIELRTDVLGAIYNVKGGIDFTLTDMGSVKLDSKLSDPDLLANNLRVIPEMMRTIAETQRLANIML